MQTMKEIVPPPVSEVRNDVAAVQALFQQNVVPSYGRFDIVISHGAGSYVYDVTGKRYLDLGGGKRKPLGSVVSAVRRPILPNLKRPFLTSFSLRNSYSWLP